MDANFSYEDAQVILRALEGHATRMDKIAQSENMIGHHKEANIAVDEAKMARRLADVLKRNGVRMQ